jgi:hypothetical protein
MKRLLLGLGATCLLSAAMVFSQTRLGRPELDFKLEERNPVSHLRLNNAAADFQFAIVSDRTGGHRARVFAQAVEQLNLLQPEFVVSVGDLIEGYTRDAEQIARQWREFQGYVAQLQMPFFYVPGNHDLSNPFMSQQWFGKFGRTAYHFVYRDVLFLVLNSEDPPGEEYGHISDDQLAYVKRTLEEYRTARWTLVFLHKPMWDAIDTARGGWNDAEKLLGERKYTVFAGHIHQYRKFIRNGHNYYQLATTGGSSKMRGVEYGEFDHIVWVTMKPDGPVLANILLDGIYPEDLKKPVTSEEASLVFDRKFTQSATGKVCFEGAPVPQAYVVFRSAPKPGTREVYADAITGADGSFTLSTYTANDGVPAGEYVVTIVWRKPFYDAAGQPGPNHLPARYAHPKTTPLKAVVEAGSENVFPFELSK